MRERSLGEGGGVPLWKRGIEGEFLARSHRRCVHRLGLSKEARRTAHELQRFNPDSVREQSGQLVEHGLKIRMREAERNRQPNHAVQRSVLGQTGAMGPGSNAAVAKEVGQKRRGGPVHPGQGRYAARVQQHAMAPRWTGQRNPHTAQTPPEGFHLSDPPSDLSLYPGAVIHRSGQDPLVSRIETTATGRHRISEPLIKILVVHGDEATDRSRKILRQAGGDQIPEAQQLLGNLPEILAAGGISLLDEQGVLEDPGGIEHEGDPVGLEKLADPLQMPSGHRLPATGIAGQLEADKGDLLGIGTDPRLEGHEVEIAGVRLLGVQGSRVGIQDFRLQGSPVH